MTVGVVVFLYHLSRALRVGFIQDVDNVVTKGRWTIERDAEASPANVVSEDFRVIDRWPHPKFPSDRTTVSW